MKPFKPSSEIFLLTVSRRYFFCGSFAFIVYCCLLVTCWERAGLLAFVGDVYCTFVTLLCGILGHVWFLVVSIPDLGLLSYFDYSVPDTDEI